MKPANLQTFVADLVSNKAKPCQSGLFDARSKNETHIHTYVKAMLIMAPLALISRHRRNKVPLLQRLPIAKSCAIH